MKMRQNPESTDSSDKVGNCDACGQEVFRYRGDNDITCENPTCSAIYNCFGQRLRDDLYSRPNPSEWDDDITDLDGFEIAMSRGEDW